MAAIEHGRDTVATRLPVIALTANAPVGDHAQCLTAGTDGDLSNVIMAAQLDELLAHRLSPGKGPAAAAERTQTLILDETHRDQMRATTNPF